MKRTRSGGFVAALVALPAMTVLAIAQLAGCGGDDAANTLGPDASEASTTDGTTPSDGSTPLDATTDADASATPTPDADAGTDADAPADADASPAADGAACGVAVPAEGDFFNTVAGTVCQSLKACCNTGTNFDMQGCLATYGKPQFGGPFGVGFAVEHLEGGRIAYDPSAACDCITSLASINCGLLTQASFTSIQTSCFGAVHGTVPATSADAGDAGDAGSAACASSYECINGAYCTLEYPADPGDASLGSCLPLVADGGSCSTDKQCSYLGNSSPSEYCNGTTHTCVPRLSAGTDCKISSNCISDICAFVPDGSPICATGEVFAPPSVCTSFALPDAGPDASDAAADAGDGGD